MQRQSRLRRAFFATCLVLLTLPWLSVHDAHAQTSDIGVDVRQTTTTTTAPPPTTTTLEPALPSVATTTTTVVVTVPPTLAPNTTETLPSVLPETPPEVKEKDTGITANLKTGLRVARDIVASVAGGTPAAEVLQAVLPGKVADVVVPAVRTASTFVFPIGLVFAVLGFLIVQRRIDASDPKLIASPLTHDDDEVRFR